MPRPSKLYKYQPYSILSLDNLKNRHLWFSKPSKFNDPFDCAIQPVVSDPSEEEWRTLYQDARDDVTNKERFDLVYTVERSYNERFKSHIKSMTQKYLQDRLHVTLHERGVACFSETCDNLLMWSHYTNGHRGFCLEYDTRYDPFDKANRVDYSETFPSLNPIEFIREGPSEELMGLVWTKSLHWTYEKEWRVFHKTGDQMYALKVPALTAIYLGCAMPQAHREIIALLLAGSRTQLHQMVKVPGEFKLLVRVFG